MDGHEQQELSDTALEKELEAALGVDPSPEFLPRVRARIASERVGETWVPFWPWRWAGAAAAVALVAVAGLWMLREPVPAPLETRVADAPKVQVSQPGAEAVSQPAPEAGSTAFGVTPAAEADRSSPVEAPRAARSSRPPGIMEAEVLISEDEAAALKQLFAAIGERRLETSALPDLASALQPPEPIEDIVLEPISISPLAPLEGE
jgi:hypothetical protein